MNDTLLTLKTFVPVRPDGLEAVNFFFEALHANQIQYCHWKSNIRLDQSLTGKTDLDLLVNRAHCQALRQILLEQNIIQISPPPGQQYPGMEHYLGFDHISGSLFHLHIHYQLVLGEEYIKNFRLPLENIFLQNTRTLQGVQTPIPELEIAILAIRVLLKYRFRDAVKDILSIRSPGIKKAFQDEIVWLLSQTNLEKIHKTLSTLTPSLPLEIILDFLTTLNASPRNGYKFVSLQRKLKEVLRPYQRHTIFSATLHYFQELWSRRKSFRKTSPTIGLKLPQGGISIAMLGADGSGKSTLSKEISDWLSWKLDVQNFYLGSKQPSAMSQYFYWIFRLARRTQHTAAKFLSDKNPIIQIMGKIKDFFLYLHHISTGRDRIQRYEKGNRFATDGSVVIFDRFPLSSFKMATNIHLLDGPRIRELSINKPSSIAKYLSAVEQNIYQKIDPPDITVFLKVSPEVSILRKPDHLEEIIRIKSKTIANLASQMDSNKRSDHCITINADLPIQQVLLQLKREIWNLL